MSKPYRVIQWATGHVGKVAIRHFTSNPVFELVGVFVSDPTKAGRDAGEIAEIDPIGVLATNDVEEILRMDADCVLFAQRGDDIDMVCRLLRSGKNVVSPIGPYYPKTEFVRDASERIRAACMESKRSFYGTGVHPGFAGDLLPLTLCRVMERIDHIHVYEVVDFVRHPSNYIEASGMGRPPAEMLANPSRSPTAPFYFEQSMALIADQLGVPIEKLESKKFEVATATCDIPIPGGLIRTGTVAGQHYEWTAWSGGKPIITYHFYWVLGENLEPKWGFTESAYRVRFEGNPPMEVVMYRPDPPEGQGRFGGLPWTAMMNVNAIPKVCNAKPGILTHLDLGIFGPVGLFR